MNKSPNNNNNEYDDSLNLTENDLWGLPSMKFKNSNPTINSMFIDSN